MKNVINVSFPRSGHHLLVNLLATYCSDGKEVFKTDGATITDKVESGQFVYCPCYPHCNAAPCIDDDTTWTKTHDFELVGEPYFEEYHIIDPGECCVIQYRNIEESLASLKLFQQRFEYYQNRSSLWWSAWHIHHMQYWSKFCDKWLINPSSNSVLVDYEDLVKFPIDELRKVCTHVDIDVDESLLQKTVSLYDIRFRKKLDYECL